MRHISLRSANTATATSHIRSDRIVLRQRSEEALGDYMSECFHDAEFYGGNDSASIYTIDEEGEVYDAIKDAGRPIALVDAIKIAATKNVKVRDFFVVDEDLSGDDPWLWRLI